ncbi:MAG: D-alanyl-D-alanine carboxypeptidase [Bacillota bacterium]|nr:MAG: D-alanyl-D-alanine carboxypeptidase [Bacillota bacterium]
MKRIAVLCICALIGAFSCYAPNATATAATSYDAQIVMEVNSLRVLLDKDGDKKMFPASTTKILTAICAIENADLDESVTIKKECVGIEGSSIYLTEGEKLTVKELLYGLMLRSGNDAATALALHVSGSIEKFASLMNETAEKAGAKHSNFVNPHGLPDDGHYVTANDLALITAYSLKNPDFKEIVSTKKIEISNGDKPYKRLLINKNKMLFECEGATGVKTGYTKKAGRCLVSSCERNGMELVSVVLNCPPMFETAKGHFDEYFSKYKLYKLFESDFIVDFLPVEGKQTQCALYIKSDVLLPLTENEYENIEIEYDLPDILPANVKKDQQVGKINFRVKNDLLFSEKIYTINGIN